MERGPEPVKLEEFTSVEFNIIKEPWNVYLLELMGERLKLRWILTRLYSRKVDTDKYDFQFKHKQLVEIENLPIAFYNDEITVHQIPREEWGNHIEEGNLDFDSLREKWNEYQFFLEDVEFRLRVKIGLNMVHRTSIINRDRMPVYLTNQNIQMNVRKIDN